MIAFEVNLTTTSNGIEDRKRHNRRGRLKSTQPRHLRPKEVQPARAFEVNATSEDVRG